VGGGGARAGLTRQVMRADRQHLLNGDNDRLVKGKASPYSTAEPRVPQLIPVLGSQPAGDVSHKPGGR